VLAKIRDQFQNEDGDGNGEYDLNRRDVAHKNCLRIIKRMMVALAKEKTTKVGKGKESRNSREKIFNELGNTFLTDLSKGMSSSLL
jgi:hypothetical protein